jgi:hypothetical protein
MYLQAAVILLLQLHTGKIIHIPKTDTSPFPDSAAVKKLKYMKLLTVRARRP